MANWISSKLKVAENLLQQIDQQAAESLKKPSDRSTSVDHNDGDDVVYRKKQPSVSPSATADEPVPLKLQLSKKTTQSGRSRDPNYKLKDQRRVNAAQYSQAKTPVSAAEDGDWTQLLGSDPSPSSTGSGPIRRQQSVKMRGLPVLNEKRRSSGRGVTGEKKSVVSIGDESFRKKSSLVKNLIERQSEGESHFSGAVDKDSEGSSSVEILPVDSVATDVAGVACSHSATVVDGESKFGSEDSHDQNEIQKSETRNMEGAVIGSSALSPTTIDCSAPHGSSQIEAGSSERSDSETDSGSSYDSEIEREKEEERRQRRERINAEKAAEAIKEREDIVAKLEGEKQSLEKILEERKKQQAHEASELQISMMEAMEAVDLEKQRHNSTRMEALARVAALESTNAKLARSLATNQWKLELEVHRISETRQHVDIKKASLEDIKRKIFKFHQSAAALKTETVNESEYKEGILEAEHSLLCDKIGYLKEKAKKIEENIEITRKEIMEPSEVEVELKGRLEQLTDHLIQKQTQVESLSSEKAMLLFRIETLLNFLDDSGLSSQLADLASGLDDADEPTAGAFVKVDIGRTGGPFNSKSRNPFPRIQSAEHHLWSFLRQLDSIFSAGALFMRKNPMAKTWAIVYLICLHFWFIYVFSSHSVSPSATRSGAALSLETINKTTRSE